ncbi:MAG: TraR/DksA family transcriptional regulator [Phycisphaeraceae bacterium]|nr:TraR/DksA family transcriptional regulator [Phycisphaeraceae bacterium]
MSKKAPSKKKTAKRSGGAAKPARATAAPKSKSAPAKKKVAKGKPAKKKATAPAAKAKPSPAAAAKKPPAASKAKQAEVKPKKAVAATASKGGAAKKTQEDSAGAPSPVLPPPVVPVQPPRPISKRPKPQPPTFKPPPMLSRLLDSNKVRKPLIPSGPKAIAQRPLGSHAASPAEQEKFNTKCPFNKRELEKFRQLLLRKRAELVGDVSMMENEALRGQSGSLSNTPSHMAEQGSEAYEQSLSLDLAAADRRLIKEIDDALTRISAGTYGVCEATGQPIKLDRLAELPWARYSIEAAREMERQAMRS